MGNDCHLRDSRHHCPTEEKDRIGSYSNGKKLSFEEWTCKTWAPDSFEFRSNEPVSRFEKFNSKSPSSILPFYSIENLIFGHVDTLETTLNSNWDTSLRCRQIVLRFVLSAFFRSHIFYLSSRFELNQYCPP